jgi:rhodanese-related sulfurtransferase
MIRLPDPLQLKQVTAAQLEQAQWGDVLIVDTREAEQFASCHIVGSIQIGIVGPFASWAAILLKPTQRILLIAEDANRALEAHNRLARVSLRDVIGYALADQIQWRRLGIAP